MGQAETDGDRIGAPPAPATWPGSFCLAFPGRAGWVVAVALLIGWPVGEVLAQDFTGLEIEEIVVKTTPRLDPIRIREVMRTREGDRYRDRAIEDDIAALWRIGSLVDVAITPTRQGDGVLLTVEAKERAVVTSVRFTGDIRHDLSDLRETTQARKGGYVDPYQLKLDLRSLRAKLREEGFGDAEVSQELLPNPQGVDVLYRIDTGPRQLIEGVQFQGNTGLSSGRLEERIVGSKPRGLLEGGGFDADLFRSDLVAVRRLYHDRGWLDATTGYRMVRDDTRQRLHITVLVREGPRYTIDHIVVVGNSLFTDREVRDAMGQHEGGWYMPEQLREDIERLQALYGEQGYLNASIGVRRVFSAGGHAVTLRLSIEEGDIVWLREIQVSGNRRTLDRVIRRQLDVEPNQRLNTRKVTEGLRRLKNTGLFTPKEPAVPTDPVRMRYLDTEEPGVKDALVEVEEGRLGNIMLAIGLSSSTGLFGKFSLTHDNFDWDDPPKSWGDFLAGDAYAGAGQKSTISLSPGQALSDYRIRWFNPALNDSVYTGGFDLYLRGRKYREYMDTRTGIRLNVGRRFGHDLQLSAITAWEDIRIHGVDGNDSDDLLAVEGHNEKRSVAVSASYDKRDFTLWPAKGYRLDARVESAGSFLGGDVDCVKEIFEANGYWTLWDQPKRGKHILHLRGQVGLAQPVGGDWTVPIFERFFVGGLGSLRGFDQREVGPVDRRTGQHVGGKVQMVGNVEYFCPIIRDHLHVVGFSDVGKVDRHTGDLDLERIRVTLGFGARVRVPMAGLSQVPLILDWGFPVLLESTDDRRRFSFSMGSGFAF